MAGEYNSYGVLFILHNWVLMAVLGTGLPLYIACPPTTHIISYNTTLLIRSDPQLKNPDWVPGRVSVPQPLT